MHYIFEKVNIECTKLKLIKDAKELKEVLIDAANLNQKNKKFISIRIDLSLENKINPKEVTHRIGGSTAYLIVCMEIKDLSNIIKDL